MRHQGIGIVRGMSRWVAAVALSASLGLAAEPATVEQAAKVLDLTKLPRIEGSEKPGYFTLANLYYAAPKGVKSAYEFHLKQLVADGWKEQPNSYVTDESASATLSKNGYTLSLSASPGSEKNTSQILIANHGNVDLAKVPAPPKSKPLYAFATTAAHITDLTPEAATTAVTELLTKAGWTPYGESPGLWHFKKNAVRLQASIGTAPAQDNKTHVTYSSEQMSADLPVPESAEGIDYRDTLLEVTYSTAQPAEEVIDFYRKTLKPMGWAPVTDEPIEDGPKQMLYFASKPQGRLSLTVAKEDGRSAVQLTRQTAEELEEIKRLLAEEKKKPKPMPEPEPEKKDPVVKLKLPAGAKNVETEDDELKFNVTSGKAKAAAESFRKALKAAGWKEESASLEDVAGTLAFEKDGGTISIVYVDAGVFPAEVTVSGFRVKVAKE